tara:strand:+ start:261 stop:4118 length:3858 start_codon:yes stop_codon:yes gene_type:complete
LLHHWSESAKIKNVLPHRHGTGIPGEETRRKRTYPREWVDRSYFGMNSDHLGGYVKEPALGKEEYAASIPYNKIYDWNKDPRSFRAKAGEKWGRDYDGLATEMEKLVKNAGYTGYWTPRPYGGGLVFASFKPIKVTHVTPETSPIQVPSSEPRFSVAHPPNSRALHLWHKLADTQTKTPDGTPKTYYFGSKKYFTELKMEHETGATFVSESPAFAGDWAGQYYNPYDVEKYGDKAIEITPDEYDEFGYLKKERRPTVTAVHIAPRNIFDFRDPFALEVGEEYLRDRYAPNDPVMVAHPDHIEKQIERLKGGDWGIIERHGFIQMIRDKGYDAFVIVESQGRAVNDTDNPINIGIFDRDDVKSVFNNSFARDGSLSIAPSMSTADVTFLDKFSEKNVKLKDRILKTLRDQFAPGGLLPEIAFDLKLTRDGRFRVADDITARTLAASERAAKEGYGTRFSNLTAAQQAEITAALDGSGAIDALPAAMQASVKKMRKDIDAQSKEYLKIIDAVIADLEEQGKPDAAERAAILRDLIQGNMGGYVTRSYKVFDNPVWWKYIPQDVKDNALAFLTKQYDGDHLAAQRVFTELTKGGNTAFTSMEALIKESTLGAKDLRILMKRKKIAPEIRALMGEYANPQHNYARTMLKLSRLIWNTHFQNELLAKGEGKFLFEDGTQPPEFSELIATPGSDSLSALRNMRTTPEIAKALRDATGKSSLPEALSMLIGINGVVKAGKIIYSPPTQLRNLGSATFFGVLGGSLNYKEVLPAAKIIWDQIKGKEGTNADVYRYYIDINLTQDTPNAGMVQDLMRDGDRLMGAVDNFMQENLGTGVAGNLTSRAKNFHKIVTNLYRAGDDIWKIIIFESQLADYMKATGLTRTQTDPVSGISVERTVAQRVRNTVPTYSLTGKGIKNLGRFPLMGPYVAFASEIIRTSINNIKLIKSDLADPRLKTLAYRRIAGTVIAHAWAKAAMGLSMALLGIDDDEEESLRKIGVGPWGKNSDYAFTGRNEKGQLTYVDLSFVDPYNMLHKSITALQRGDNWFEGLASAVGEIILPFVQPDIAAGAIYEVAANKKILSGAPVYNPDAPPEDITEAIATHLFFQLGPGVLNPTRKITKAFMGDRDFNGRVYDMENEVMGMFGARVSTFDPKFSLYWRTGEFNEHIANSRKYLSKVAQDINPRSEGELKEAFKEADEIRLRAYDDMMQFVNAAKKSGLSDQQVRKVLRLSGVSKRYANALARGRPPPRWRLGPSFMKGATKRAKLLIDRDTANVLQERKRFVREVARTAPQ